MYFLPSSTRFASRSHTAISRAVSNLRMFGMSWPREMRPAPIAPMLMRLLGDADPKTDAGTMAGKPAAADATAAALPTDDRNDRRVRLGAPALAMNILTAYS